MIENSKTLYLDTEELDIGCKKCDFKPTDKIDVLKSINIIGSYNYDTGEFVDGTEPSEDGWEIIVSGDKKHITEDKDSIHISPEGLYFFCPDCLGDPKIVSEND